MIYPILRNLLFNFPAEEVHYFSMNNLHKICASSLGRSFLQSQFSVKHKSLEKEVFGLHFTNPVGLGAGFDKNASYLKELACLGFGFVEIGTVTPKAQDGNDKPRVFRLPKDKGLINRMGFNNQGVLQAKQRLIEWNNSKTDKVGGKMIVGGNIGKNKRCESPRFLP